MQPCDELKNLVLQHYGKFTASGLTEPIRETYSLQKGVTIIAADSKEWFDNRNAILRFIEEGSASKLEIGVENLAAYCEGSVGWTADQVKVQLPDGAALTVRHTRIFHQEDGVWKLVHLHVSIPVTD